MGNFYLFDTDEREAKRLKMKYQKFKNIKVFNFGLFSQNKKLNLSITEHPALSSIKQINKQFLKDENYKQEEFATKKTKKITVRKIDTLFKATPIDFLKIDCEGAELEILKGAKFQLKNSIIGVRSEVCFSKVFYNSALFGEIHKYLLNLNFELINFDYNGEGNIFGRYGETGKFGKLVSTDAVWVKKDLLEDQGALAMRHEKILKKSIFLFENSAADLAIETLLDAVKKGARFSKYSKNAIFNYLKIKTLLLFKGLKNKPGYKVDELENTYQEIFNECFPSAENFYEKASFENINNGG